jgi:O-antigen/teichoic acid export membrane protein
MMRMSIILRAVATSWIAVLANAFAGFFLTPLILHHLGDEAFGLWILVVTVVGYYGFLDIGVGSAVVRYVSLKHALGDKEGLTRVVASAFYFYTCVCLVVVALTFLLAPWLPRFFPVHANLIVSFRSLFLLAGVMQGLTFPLLIFGGVLQAAARFDQFYTLRIASLVFRVIAVIAACRAGGGLFAVGAAVLVPNLLYFCAQIPLAFRAVPEISLHPKWITKSSLHDIFGYGSTTLAVTVGEQLSRNIHPLIIARFLTPVAVTLFSLPMKLLALPLEGLSTMTAIVNPISSTLEARKNLAALRRLIQLSVQSAYLILAPIAAFLFIFGKELLSLWMGPKYVSTYPLLVLLTIGVGTAAAQFSVQSMLFGIAQHRELMWYRLGEGLSIALLGTVFLRIWGLSGLALVSAVTLLLTNLVLIPRHLCRILSLSLRTYLEEGCLKPCVLALPFAGILMGARWLFVVNTWPVLTLSLLAAGLTYIIILSIFIFRIQIVGMHWLSLGLFEILENKFFGTTRVKVPGALQKVPAEQV